MSDRYKVHDSASLERSTTSSSISFIEPTITEPPKSLREKLKLYFKNSKYTLVNDSLPTFLQRSKPKVYRFPPKLERKYQRARSFSMALFTRALLAMGFIGVLGSGVLILIQYGLTVPRYRNLFIAEMTLAAVFFLILTLSLICWKLQTPITSHVFTHFVLILCSAALIAVAVTAGWSTATLACLFATITVGLPVFSAAEIAAYFIFYIFVAGVAGVVNQLSTLGIAQELLIMAAIMILCLNIFRVVSYSDREAFLTQHMIEQNNKLIQREYEKNKLLLLNVLPAKVVDILQQQRQESDAQSEEQDPEAEAQAPRGIIHESYSEATIMFVKIVSFSEITKQLQAIDIIQLLNEVFTELDSISERHNLYRIKTIGSTYMCTSGIPDPAQDHVDNAVLAALDMLEAFKTKRIGLRFLDYPVEIAVGINEGPVVAGVIGSTSLAYDVWSDAVNIAARMVYYASPSTILVPHRAYSKLQFKDRYVTEEPKTLSVKGKGEIICYTITRKAVAIQKTEYVNAAESTNRQRSGSKLGNWASNVTNSSSRLVETKERTLLEKMADWAKEDQEDAVDAEFNHTPQLIRYEKNFDLERMAKHISSRFMEKMPSFFQYFSLCCFLLKSKKLELHYRIRAHKIGYQSVQLSFLYYIGMFIATIFLEVCDIELRGRQGSYQSVMIMVFAILLPIHLIMYAIIMTPLLRIHASTFYFLVSLFMVVIHGGNLAFGLVHKDNWALYIRLIQGMLITAPMQRVTFELKVIYNICALACGAVIQVTGALNFGQQWVIVFVMFLACSYAGIVDDVKQKGDFFLRVLAHKKRKVFDREQQQCRDLLLNILPPNVLENVAKAGAESAGYFEMIGVLFCDICHFTVLAGTLKPIELVRMLSDLFSAFDNISKRYDVLKVKTIGDCYECASGILSNHRNHLKDLANMALEMITFVRDYKRVEMRFGVHCGSAVGGIVGQKRFAYDLYGTTIDFASHMEQTSKTMMIHCSEEFFFNVSDSFEFETREDEVQNMKNANKIHTYFLRKQKEERKKSFVHKL